MKALILAAGEGTRLRPYTNSRPKCMVELVGKSLLQRQLAVLRACGVNEIAIVAGYLAGEIPGGAERVFVNAEYHRTNMVHSLFQAREWITGDADLLISYGDIVYEPRVLKAVASGKAPISLAVDLGWRRYWEARMADPLSDAETLKLDPDGRVLELGKKPGGYEDIQGQYLGLFKIRADHLEALKEAYDGMDKKARYDGQDFANMYMTSFLQWLIEHGWRVQSVPLHNGWLEVDTAEDLVLYERLHSEGALATFCALD